MTDRFGYGEIGLDINPRHPCDGCKDYEAPDGCKSNGGCGKPQTNADRIRAMTDEELAEWLDAVSKSWYDEGYTKDDESPLISEYPATANEWIAWLKSPAEVDNGN